MANYNEEAIFQKKFLKFKIFSDNGNREVTAPHRMTLDEAMKHFHALSIGGIE